MPGGNIYSVVTDQPRTDGRGLARVNGISLRSWGYRGLPSGTPWPGGTRRLWLRVWPSCCGATGSIRALDGDNSEAYLLHDVLPGTKRRHG